MRFSRHSNQQQEASMAIDLGNITNIVLKIVANRDQFIGIIQEAIALWNKVKTVLPDLARQVEGTAPAMPNETYSINWLQESLNKLMNAGLKVDGSYGAGTQAAVKKFQE